MSVFPSDEAAYAVGIVLGILVACVILTLVGYILYKRWNLSALEADDEELTFLKMEVGKYEAPSQQEREERMTVADRPGTQQATKRQEHEVVNNPLRDAREEGGSAVPATSTAAAPSTTTDSPSSRPFGSPAALARGAVSIEEITPQEGGVSTTQLFHSRPRFMTAAHVAKVVRRASNTTGNNGSSQTQGKNWKF